MKLVLMVPRHLAQRHLAEWNVAVNLSDMLSGTVYELSHCDNCNSAACHSNVCHSVVWHSAVGHSALCLCPSHFALS